MKRFLLLLTALLSAGAFAQDVPDSLALGEVVITATKTEVSRNQVPMTVSVITREQLDQSDESALLPILSEQIPGLFITERGITGFGVSAGAAGQINMRGLGGSPTTQVLVLIDGHPQFMGMMGHHLPDSYVASDAERIEVVRGPASVLYGSNAMAGAINIITRHQKEEGVSANARLMYGSFNTQKYMLSTGVRKGKFDAFASVNHDRTDGHRDSSGFLITNGYLKSGYAVSDFLRLTADFNLAQYKSGDPGVEGGPAGDTIDIMRGKAALSLENSFDRMKGALKIYHNFGEHEITDGWHSVDQMSGVMLYQAVSLFEGSTLTAGYDYMEYGGKGSTIMTVLRDENGAIIPGPRGPQFVVSDKNDRWTETSNQALYGLWQQRVGTSLMLNAGVRYESNPIYGSEWIPSAGLAWHAGSSTDIKASVSKGYRPPSIRELYFFPPANDALVPERLMNYELGWYQHWAGNKVRTEITAFLVQGDNLIVTVPAVAPPPPLYKNSGDFSNAGVEMSLSCKLNTALSFMANYTYIDMETPLAATPVHHAFVSVRYQHGKFVFNIKAEQVNDLYGLGADGKAAVVEPNYTLLGLRAQYAVRKSISLFVSGENLLDEAYQINRGYPMPGATAFVGMNIRID